MKITAKTVYVTEDGESHDTHAEAKTYAKRAKAKSAMMALGMYSSDADDVLAKASEFYVILRDYLAEKQ